MLHTQKNFWEHLLIISPCCSILLFDIRLQIPGHLNPHAPQPAQKIRIIKKNNKVPNNQSFPALPHFM